MCVGGGGQAGHCNTMNKPFLEVGKERCQTNTSQNREEATFGRRRKRRSLPGKGEPHQTKQKPVPTEKKTRANRKQNPHQPKAEPMSTENRTIPTEKHNHAERKQNREQRTVEMRSARRRKRTQPSRTAMVAVGESSCSSWSSFYPPHLPLHLTQVSEKVDPCARANKGRSEPRPPRIAKKSSSRGGVLCM